MVRGQVHETRGALLVKKQDLKPGLDAQQHGRQVHGGGGHRADRLCGAPLRRQKTRGLDEIGYPFIPQQALAQRLGLFLPAKRGFTDVGRKIVQPDPLPAVGQGFKGQGKGGEHDIRIDEAHDLALPFQVAPGRGIILPGLAPGKSGSVETQGQSESPAVRRLPMQGAKHALHAGHIPSVSRLLAQSRSNSSGAWMALEAVPSPPTSSVSSGRSLKTAPPTAS